MALLGSSPRPGFRAQFANALVATPEQEEETRRLEQMFLARGQQLPVPSDAPSMSTESLAGSRSSLLGSGNPMRPQTKAPTVGGNATTPSPAAMMNRNGGGDGIAMRGEWEHGFPDMQQKDLRWIEGGKFRGKDAFALALAAIGDVAAQQSGGQPTAMPFIVKSLMGNREAQRAAQAAQLKRQQDWDDWVRRQQYEAANRAPANNDTVADYEFIAQKLGPEEAKRYLQGKADPVVNIPLPGGQTYIGPRSVMPSTLGGQSSTALPTVSDEASYNALPPGAQYRDPNGNLRTKGGGAGNGAGGFPIPSGNPLQPPRW